MGEDEASEESERHTQDDRHGDEQTLVETAEDEVDKHDTDDEHKCRGVLG